ncbi:MAG: hypothetical protein FWF54_11435 [Candidatus Azobacteroides sp.]|nr:hypothetical protein [Candidatus Azobacteroides sp.]
MVVLSFLLEDGEIVHQGSLFEAFQLSVEYTRTVWLLSLCENVNLTGLTEKDFTSSSLLHPIRTDKPINEPMV